MHADYTPPPPDESGSLPPLALAAASDSNTNSCDGVALLHRLRSTLELCCALIEAGDFIESEHELSRLVVFLNPICDAIIENGKAPPNHHQKDENELENSAFEILTEIRLFITSPSLAQAAIDALSFELPKLAARFGCASQRCLELAESIVGSFTHMCDPRDMLSILCEALGSCSEMFQTPHYFSSLFSGFPEVFVSMRKRQFEQVKAAIPVILNALRTISMHSDDDDGDTDPVNLFHRVNCIADSVKTICLKLQGKDHERLHALLGLFVLQIMALVSIGMKHRLSDCRPLVLHLSHFLPYCDLTYIGLITGTHVNNLLHISIGDDRDDCVGCFSHVSLGASLAVIWGSNWNEVATAAEADLARLKDELQSSQDNRWKAVDMLKHVFLCVNLPWELKQQAVNFILNIVYGNLSQISHDQDADYTSMPSLYTAFQAIQAVLMYAPYIELRRNAFATFKKLLADLPTILRFENLRALIKNSDSSSMIAVLLDCVKEELHTENSKRTSVLKADSGPSEGLCFWSASVLELVELVLRPPEGGPPLLPEHSDAVLSALNLYRFILITESTGKTNYTGVLSKEQLMKAHREWFLPLRTLVTGIAAENAKDYDQLASDISCGLNPVELVLYRCIELVEEHFV